PISLGVVAGTISGINRVNGLSVN
ncbi:hypothetical protein TIFTF001_022714, partial [Ficus carica]